MKRNRLFTAISLVTALLLTACTQDELAEQGNTLPDGEYPLQIGSVSITAEVSEEPWAVKSPQTRLADYDDTDGTHKSRWTEGDKIKVTVTPQSGTAMTTTCTLDADGNITNYNPQLYWKNTGSATISAWYSNIRGQNTSDNTVSLADQSGGLAYVLKADDLIGVNYQSTSLSLTFKHQLAKIRVKLDGEKAADVTSVSVKSNTGCTVSNGDVTGSGEGFIPMHKATYGSNTYWEANVVPGTVISDFQLSDGTNTVTCTLTAAVTPVEATLHEITITVNPATVEDGATITESGEYTMSGDYTQGVTIDATDKDITLILEGVTITTSGPGISITGGRPTIQVSGENNEIISTNNSGIGLSHNADVTIVGTNANDKLTVSGGTQGSMQNATAGAGIGSIIGGTGGDITIQNVTIDAKGGSDSMNAGGAGIGSSATGTIGNIIIEESDITASGGTYAAAIGMGYSMGLSTDETCTMGNISITDSEIVATGGRAASVIGLSYFDIAISSATAGKIIIETPETFETFLGQLTLTQGSGGTQYKIGKGRIVSPNTTITFGGVTLTASDDTQNSQDGIGQ